MTVKEFAARAEISTALVYSLVAEGVIPHRRIGLPGKRGTIRFSEADFEAFSVQVQVGSSGTPTGTETQRTEKI